MTDSNDNDTFGAGIFETDATNVPPEEPANEPMVLTEREAAIAAGDDPDDPDASRQIQRDNEARATGAVAEDNDEPDDTDPGGDEPETDDEPDDTEASVEWSESDRRLAAIAGLTDDDLAKLSSVDALHSTLDVLSRHKPKGNPKTNDNPDGAEAEAEGVEDDQQTAGTGESSNEALKAIEKLKPIDLSEFEGYEGTDLKLIESVKETQEALKKVHDVLAQQTTVAANFEEQQVAAAQAQVENQFNGILDRYPQIYGEMKNGKVAKDFRKARDEVRDQVEIIWQGHVSRGTSDTVDLNEVFGQAMRAVHGNQTRKNSPTTAQSQDARREKLKKQSNMRRSPGRKAASAKRVQTQSDDPEVIADDPELVEFFKNAQVENGVV